MNILIDYENTGMEGLSGIEELSADDEVEIYYSDKNNRIDLGVVGQIKKSACGVDIYKTEKSAPNYLDFHIACRATQVLMEKPGIAIISKDKGYISVQDFHARMGKTVYLYKSIEEFIHSYPQTHMKTVFSYRDQSFHTNTSAIGTSACGTSAVDTSACGTSPVDTSAVGTSVCDTGIVNNDTSIIDTSITGAAGTSDFGAPDIETAAPKEKKKVSRINQKRHLSNEEKLHLKELLKDLPKHNGRLQQCVIDCFSECSNLGQMRYKLIADIGRCDGEKAYAIIESAFAEFKGLEIVKAV